MDSSDLTMPTTWDNQPQCHFVFIRYLRGDGASWRGTIINPRSGNIYGVAVGLASQQVLKLRGFVFLPLLGATRYWARYNGPPPPADCRMAPNSLG